MRWISRAAVVSMIAAASVAGCDRRPDAKEMASNALDQANIDDVNVDWDRDARVLHMTGTVQNAEERNRAEQVVSTALGSSGLVVNELTVEGRQQKMADELDGGIRERLDNVVEGHAILKDRNVEFEVHNGVVTIKGDVASAEEKDRAAELARNVPGVREVVNALEIKGAH